MAPAQCSSLGCMSLNASKDPLLRASPGHPALGTMQAGTPFSEGQVTRGTTHPKINVHPVQLSSETHDLWLAALLGRERC